MLDPIAQLPEHRLGDIQWILGDKINAHTLGADQTDDLLDLLNQCGRCAVKQQVRLVEKEHQQRLIEIADLGKLFKEL